MLWIKWTGILAAIALVITCFLVWVTIPSKNIVVSGIDAAGTNFGKPGYFHFICVIFFLFFSLTPRVWAKRSNLLVTVLNMSWALRNYFIITMCSGGICPEKHVAVYAIVLFSAIMLVSSLLPDLKTKSDTRA